MNRRGLLRLGIGTGAAFLVAGGAVSWLPPAYESQRLSASSRALFAALAPVLLQTTLPGVAPSPEATQEVDALLGRLDATIAGLPSHARSDLGTLLRLLGTAVGRWGLTGDTRAWDRMSNPELSAVLTTMRESSNELRQQAYHALRDLTMASYFADSTTWSRLGYPGPLDL